MAPHEETTMSADTTSSAPLRWMGHTRHLATGRAREETRHTRVGQERHVRVGKRRLDANHLRVAFSVDQTGKTVTRLAPDAPAFLGIRFVQHDAERNVEGT